MANKQVDVGLGPNVLSPTLQRVYNQMMHAYETKENVKARKLADQILKEHPKHGETLSIRALVMDRDVSSHEDIVAELKAGIKGDGNSVLCWHALGAYYKDKKMWREALNALKMAKMKVLQQRGLRHGGNESMINKELVMLLMQLREFPEALKTAMDNMNSSPMAVRDPVNWMTMVMLNYLTGKVEGALDSLASTWNSGIFDGLSNYIKGQLILFQMMLELRRYADTKPDSHPCMATLEKAVKREGKWAGATIDWRQIYLFSFVAHVQAGEYESAHQLVADELLDREPQNLDFLLLSLYSHKDVRVRSLFGEPLKPYEVVMEGDAVRPSRYSKSMQMPGDLKLTESSAFLRLESRQEHEQTWEPFRLSVDLLHHLTDSVWLTVDISPRGTRAGTGYLNPRNAQELAKWTGLLGVTEKAEPEVTTAVRETIGAIVEGQNDEKKRDMHAVLQKYLTLFFSPSVEVLKTALTRYVTTAMERSEGATAKTLAPFLKAKPDMMRAIVTEGVAEAKTSGTVPLTNQTRSANWLTLQAEFLCYFGEISQAAASVDEALELTAHLCKNAMLVKAEICKSALNHEERYQWTLRAHLLDTADKNVNSLLVKACHATDRDTEAFETVGKYTRDGVPRDWLLVQSHWGFRAFAKNALRNMRLGEFLEVTRRMRAILQEGFEDHYDFHQYAMRVGNLNTYVQLLAYLCTHFQTDNYRLAYSGAAALQLLLAADESILNSEVSRLKALDPPTHPIPAATQPGVPPGKMSDYDTQGLKEVLDRDSASFTNEAEALVQHMRIYCPMAAETWYLSFEIASMVKDERLMRSAFERMDMISVRRLSHPKAVVLAAAMLRLLPSDSKYSQEEILSASGDLKGSGCVESVIVGLVVEWFLLRQVPVIDHLTFSNCQLKELEWYCAVDSDLPPTALSLWFNRSHPFIVRNVSDEDEIEIWKSKMYPELRSAIATTLKDKILQINTGKPLEEILTNNSYLD